MFTDYWKDLLYKYQIRQGPDQLYLPIAHSRTTAKNDSALEKYRNYSQTMNSTKQEKWGREERAIFARSLLMKSLELRSSLYSR